MRGRGGDILATVDQQAQRITLHLVSTTDEHGQARLLAPDEPDGVTLANRVQTLSAKLGTTTIRTDNHLEVIWQ